MFPTLPDPIEVVVGIDPGFEGAFTALTLDGKVVFRSVMPTVTERKPKRPSKAKKKKKKAKKSRPPKDYRESRSYDECALLELTDMLLSCRVVAVALETQHPMSKQGVVSTFATGRGYGQLLMLVASKFGPELRRDVAATTWQAVWRDILRPPSTEPKKSRVKKKSKSGAVRPEKKGSRNGHLVCAALFPGVSLLATSRSTVPHTGLVDSLLIAEYIRREVVLRRSLVNLIASRVPA